MKPFPQNLTIVDILLFGEFPSTVVYSDLNNDVLIVEWIDIENGVDKYFIYEVTYQDLKKFIKYETSHYDIVKCAVGGHAIFFEGSLEDPKNVHSVDVIDIHEDHLPSKNIIDLLNVHKIAYHFNLK